ncbi:unnamed protein product [Nippostrongylus brasiliensis]|uniref:Uncharacterized protein n=1 Tax=Nippostrongylus brasiliensis TaxID=27835 RepID=A0A0N4Y330_NIPBR|nr:unnamed protein product [Nippostrongylus brasiliensis]
MGDDFAKETTMSKILDMALQKRRGQGRRKKGFDLRKHFLQTQLIRTLSSDINKILTSREKRRRAAQLYLKDL